MTFSPQFCDLCGLPLRQRGITASLSAETLHFCCRGCSQVFQMLVEKHGSGEVGSFRETELFKKCRELGIIPSAEEAAGKGANGEGETSSPSPSRGGGHLSLSLKLGGMWCPACAWVIEETLRKSPGLLKVECSFSADRVRCDYDPILASPSTIMESIARLGYQASSPVESEPSKERGQEIIRLAVSAFLTMNVMMISFGVYAGFFTEISEEAIRKLSWPLFIMATIVLFWGGRSIYRRALKGIFSAGFSMETLITVGSLTAYLYSTYRFFSGSLHLYYDTACMLVVLVLLGKFLESGAKARIQEDLDHLFSLRPSKAKLLVPGSEKGRYVSIEHLRRGDCFEVVEGEVVPADGKVLGGEAEVDESHLTGEARPVAKALEDDLRSGARVIQGSLRARAERVGDESTLGQLLRITEEALRVETPFEGKANQVLRWFVPLVLVMSAATGVVCLGMGLTVEEAIIRSMTVLVISCPCTLGIAIPLTRLAGISMAEKRGILVRDFSSFEKALDLDAFVIDKTGTVTEGRWKLLDIVPTGLLTRQEVLDMAVSVEEQSQHHIASELKKKASPVSSSSLSATGVVISANGIEGLVRGHEVRIGSKEFMKKELEQFEGKKALIGLEANTENSYVYMSTDGNLCAVLVFGDEIKKGSSETIGELKGRGYRLSLVSGDGNDATRAIARRIGLDESHGGRLPEDKAAFIKKLQSTEFRVAMVGDGINDAPALAQADLGMALYSGGHLGQEAGDVTLMRGDLSQVLDFLDLARRVSRKIRQNLVFSGAYNLVAIPVAMSGLLNPLIAVSAMLLSSLSVIGNTLLLIKRAG